MSDDTKTTNDLAARLTRLEDDLRSMQSVVTAFSGGVDSTFLAAMAGKILGDKALAVTATSPTYAQREFREAKQLAESFGMRHLVVDSDELAVPGFSDNPPDRCYFCKKELFTVLRGIADREKIAYVLDGTNADDMTDFRPGRRAARELGVRSPLMDAGLTKDDIREASRAMELPTADKPAIACMASRFPYGSAISREKLNQVELIEDFLYDSGLRTYRARHHEHILRLELGPAEMTKFMETDIRDRCVRLAKEQGFTYVTLDLEGFRSGSMNEAISEDVKSAVET